MGGCFSYFLQIQESVVNATTSNLSDYCSLLIKRAGVVELRVLGVGKDGGATYSGFFNSPTHLTQWADRYSDSASGIYTTLNEINPDCFDSDAGKFRITNQTGAKRMATWDQDIRRRLWLPMDFDPVGKLRPSSDVEVAAAAECAEAVHQWLTGEGWPLPVAGTSGNGAHLLYAVDFEENSTNAATVKRLFMRIAHHVHFHVCQHTKFDTVCHNAARIWKVYGTKAKKGNATADRPHRFARCAIPDELTLVPLSLVEELAGPSGTESRWFIPGDKGDKGEQGVSNSQSNMKSLGSGDYSTLDVVKWFEAHEKYRFEMPDGKHSVFCPWADNHSSTQDARGTDTVVWEANPDEERAWPVFHCSHEGCSNPDKTFGDLRELWGDADDYCSKKFSPEKSYIQEDLDTYVQSDMEVFESLSDKKSILGYEPRKRPSSSPTENKPFPEEEVGTPKRSVISHAPEDTHMDRVIQDLDKVIEDNKDLEEVRPFSERPGDGTDEAVVQGEDDPPSDGEDYSGEDGYYLTEDHNTPQHVYSNLVHIKGTSLCVHLAWNRIITANAIRLSYPKLGPQWLKREDRLSVMSSNIIFDPTRPTVDPDNPHILNRFRGMPVVPESSEDPQPIFDHVRMLCGGEDEAYEYVINWLAYPLQYPGFKMPTALVFQGPPGSGKNLFFDNFSVTAYEDKSSGKTYQFQASSLNLESRFNDPFSCRLFIVANEISTSRQNKTLKNKIKSMITDPTINIERKGQEAIVETNRMNVVFLSNEDTPLTIDYGDRRFVVLEHNDVMPKKYYYDIADRIKRGAMNSFIHALLKLDLSGFHPYQEAPSTHAKEQAIDNRMNPADKFCLLFRQGLVDMPVSMLTHGGVVNRTDLWDAFKIWCSLNGYAYTGHRGSFFNKFEKIMGAEMADFNLPSADSPTGSRIRVRCYVVDKTIHQKAYKEIYTRSLIFSKSVTENNVLDPKSRVEGLNT